MHMHLLYGTMLAVSVFPSRIMGAECNFPSVELQALQDLYTETEGPNWIWSPDEDGVAWNFTGSNTNPCTENWQGVNCTYAVDECYLNLLDLSSHNLAGPLPASIGQLTQLTHLELDGNFLSGTIPAEIGRLTELLLILFTANRFTGQLPVELGNLTSIRQITLTSNSLSGTLPSSLARLTTMWGFDIALNYITGPLPAWMGQWTELQYISAGGNLLTGTLPPEYASLTDLQSILVYENKLTGPLPDIFGSFPLLEWLTMQFNAFSGPLPDSLAQASSLLYIRIYGNVLTGTVPGALGDLPALYTLEVYDNHLTGALPEGLGRSNVLTNIDLHNNLLSGPFPATLHLPLILLNLDLAYNRLTGTVPRYLQLLHHLNELQLQGNQLTGSLDGVFNATALPSLSTVQLSDNALTGTLPEQLFRMPQLHVFAAVDNCFDGPLPVEAICASPSVQVLAMDGLRSASACQRKLLPGLSNAHVITHPISGGVPACLLQIPNLLTLHLSGNGLTGSIPDTCSAHNSLAPRLLDLSLSHNALTGTIPSCIQQRIWKNLDLSFNRITGSLSSTFAPNGSAITVQPYSHAIASAALSIDHNRLSGKIPGGVRVYHDLSMLTSNLFSCKLDKSDLPSADGARLDYQCGSDDLDVPYYVWLALATVFGTVTAAVLAYRLFGETATRRWPAVLQGWLRLLQSVINSVLVGSRLNSSGTGSGIGDSASLAYQSVVFGFGRLATVAGNCAGYTVVVLLPLYAGLSSHYTTVMHKYAWTVSAAYLSGLGPGVALLVTFVGLQVLFIYAWRRASAAALDRTQFNQTSVVLTALAPMDSPTHALPGVPASATTAVEPSAGDGAGSLTLWTRLAVFLTYIAVNFTVVAGVNIAYVYIALNRSGATFIIAQILISFFKLLWNKFGGVFLMRYVASHITTYEDSGFERSFELLKVFVALANNIAILCLVVAITSPDCFYNVFAAAPEVVSSYDYISCFLYDPTTLICNSRALKTGATSYTPPFAYSYQCSASFVTYYAPAFLYLCLTATFLSPALQWLLYVLHRRAATAPGTLWFQCVDRLLPPSLKPIPASGGRESAASHPEAGERKHSHFQPYFDAGVLQLNLVTYLAVILTFGAAFPPLAVPLALTVVAVLAVARFKIGRLLTAASGTANSAAGERVRKVIEQECLSVVSVLQLPAVLWMLVTLGCWFYTLFVFDTLGDAAGLVGAYWVLIVMPLMPVALYGLACLQPALLVLLTQRSSTAAAPAVSRSSEVEAVIVSPLV